MLLGLVHLNCNFYKSCFMTALIVRLQNLILLGIYIAIIEATLAYICYLQPKLSI